MNHHFKAKYRILKDKESENKYNLFYAYPYINIGAEQLGSIYFDFKQHVIEINLGGYYHLCSPVVHERIDMFCRAIIKKRGEDITQYMYDLK